MQQTIEQELGHLTRLVGQVACIVLRLDGDGPVELTSINPDLRFPAASLAKIPILVEVARQVNLGTLSWDTYYTLPEAARVEGSGVLVDLEPDLRLTLRDLAHLMIAISDNSAANMLLYIVGMEAVNSTMRDLGLATTTLGRRFMDFAARKSGRENWTTAGDMALLLSYLCSDLLPEREQMQTILLRQNDNSLLSGCWSEETPFAHKTGGLPGILHDVGILYPPGTSSTHTPLILVALTDNLPDEPFTRYVLARVGKLIFDSYR